MSHAEHQIVKITLESRARPNLAKSAKTGLDQKPLLLKFSKKVKTFQKVTLLRIIAETHQSMVSREIQFGAILKTLKSNGKSVRSYHLVKKLLKKDGPKDSSANHSI